MSDPGYPSWLPKRPPPPAPQSTVQSSIVRGPLPPSATDVFMSSGAGRKATPRSVRIVARDAPWRDREATGDSAETRVQHIPAHLQRRSMTYPLPPTRPRPRFRAPSLHLALLRSPGWSMRLRYFLHPVFIFAHLVVQTYFDFNIVFIILQFSAHPGAANNSHNWTLAAIAYIACWALQVLGVFVVYELIYSFWRRWRVKRPLILPIYLSSSAHDFAALVSYNHFCFFAYIRRSARPSLRTLLRRGRSSTPPPFKLPPHLASSPPLSPSPGPSSPPHMVSPAPASPAPPPIDEEHEDATSQVTSTTESESDATSRQFILSQFADYIAEKCYWRVQNWPTVALLLPRAALSLAVLFQRSLGPGEEAVASARDSTYFEPVSSGGGLTGYAKGILFVNAAWAAWRSVLVLGGITGLWILSGTACGGLCGPRYRWEEEPELEDGEDDPHQQHQVTSPTSPASPFPAAWDKRASYDTYTPGNISPYPIQAGYDADDTYVSDAWAWKKGTRTRVREAWEFCLTSVVARTGAGAPGAMMRESKHYYGYGRRNRPFQRRVSRSPAPLGNGNQDVDNDHDEENDNDNMNDEDGTRRPRPYSTQNVRAKSKPKFKQHSSPGQRSDAVENENEDDDYDEFAALEEIIRTSVLARGEKYRRAGAGAGASSSASGAGPRTGLSDIIPPAAAPGLPRYGGAGGDDTSPEDLFGSQRSRRSDPLRVLPFPFPTSPTSPTSGGGTGTAITTGASVGAGRGTASPTTATLVPFPAEQQQRPQPRSLDRLRTRTRSEGDLDHGNDHEGVEDVSHYFHDDDDEDHDDDSVSEPISPATRRTSASMSSLGHPLSPPSLSPPTAYPFVGIGSNSNSQSNSTPSRTGSSFVGTGTQRTRSSMAGSHGYSIRSAAGSVSASASMSGGTGRSARHSVGNGSNFSSPGLTRSSASQGVQSASSPSTNPAFSSPSSPYTNGGSSSSPSQSQNANQSFAGSQSISISTPASNIHHAAAVATGSTPSPYRSPIPAAFIPPPPGSNDGEQQGDSGMGAGRGRGRRRRGTGPGLLPVAGADAVLLPPPPPIPATELGPERIILRTRTVSTLSGTRNDEPEPIAMYEEENDSESDLGHEFADEQPDDGHDNDMEPNEPHPDDHNDDREGRRHRRRQSRLRTSQEEEYLEREDSVGLLGSSRGSLSPRSSLLGLGALGGLGGLRGRKSSGALSLGSRSRKGSAGSGGASASRSGHSGPRSRAQSGLSGVGVVPPLPPLPVRSRAQSLIQRASEFAASSTNIGGERGEGGGETRARSISQTGSQSASRSGSSSASQAAADSRRTSAGGASATSSASAQLPYGSASLCGSSSRRESSGVESNANSNTSNTSSSAEPLEGSGAPGVDSTFGRPGELRRQVEEARSRMGLSPLAVVPPPQSQQSSASLAPPGSDIAGLRSRTSSIAEGGTSISPSTPTRTPSLITGHSEGTARGGGSDAASARLHSTSFSDIHTQPSDADLSTAHESFVTAPLTIDSTSSEGGRGGGGGPRVASAWTLREEQDQWGHGVHGPA